MTTLAGSATSQVTVSLSTANTWQATAGASTQTLPQGTNLDAGGGVSASESTSSGLCQGTGAGASCDVAPVLAGTSFSATVTTLASSSSQFCAAPGGSTGPNLLHATLTAPQPTFVRVRLELEKAQGILSIVYRRIAPATISIVGSPITLSVARGASAVPPPMDVVVPVDANGTVLAITTSAQASLGLGINSTDAEYVTARISFDVLGIAPVPNISVTPIGLPCGSMLAGTVLPPAPGPTATVDLQLSVSQAPVWPASFLIVGLDDIQVPIPPTGCPLRTSILVPLPVPVSPAGTIQVKVPIAAGLSPIDLRVQHLVGNLIGGQEQWHTSQALRVQVQ